MSYMGHRGFSATVVMSVNKAETVVFLLVALVGICIAENSRSDVVLVESVETGGAQGDLRGRPFAGGDDRADFSGEAFQATTEWQDVKPGQVLPSGLHYRYAVHYPD